MLLQLVPAVTELIIAELLYLQYKDRNKPMYLYINSTGTTRADGEVVSQIFLGRFNRFILSDLDCDSLQIKVALSLYIII